MPQTKMPIIGPQWQSSYAANVAGSSWIMIETSEKLETIDLPTPAGRPALAARVVGDGPSFALFHGGFGSWTHWIRNVEPLAGKFRMLAFDLPGYGNSPDVPPETTPDDYIEWVAAAVAHATPDGCHLAGFSFGGALAARVAVRLGGHIKRLSLLGPGGFGVPVGRVIAQEKMPGPEGGRDARRAVAGRNLGQWMLSRAPAENDPVAELQLSNIERTRFDSRRISLQTTLADDLTRIAAPVQIVWGADDNLAYPSVEARADSCRAIRPDLRITIVPDGGHWIQYEQADAVNRLLLDFHGK